MIKDDEMSQVVAMLKASRQNVIMALAQLGGRTPEVIAANAVAASRHLVIVEEDIGVVIQTLQTFGKDQSG